MNGSNENTSIYAFNGLLPSRSTFAFTGGGGGDDDGDEPLGESKRLKLVQVPLPGQAEGHPKFNNLDEIYQKKLQTLSIQMRKIPIIERKIKKR